MIATVSTTKGRPPSSESLHAGFLAILPRIEHYAALAFRTVRCAGTRQECVAEVIALCWQCPSRWCVSVRQR